MNSYANGPAFYDFYYSQDGQVKRKNLTKIDQTKNPAYRFPSAGFTDSETHGGEDVATYAIGPMAHLIRNTHEQSYIAYVMSYAGMNWFYVVSMKWKFTQNITYQLAIQKKSN